MPLTTIQAKKRKEMRKQKRQKRKHNPRQQQQQQQHQNDVDDTSSIKNHPQQPHEPKSKKIKKESTTQSKQLPQHSNTLNKRSKDSKTLKKNNITIDPSLAAALQRDEEEIADLEIKLGLRKKNSSKKSRETLKKEYAKLEGYGDDFGDFLDDLDKMVQRVSGGGNSASDDDVYGRDKQDAGSVDSYSTEEDSDEENVDHQDMVEDSDDEPPDAVLLDDNDDDDYLLLANKNKNVDSDLAAAIQRDNEEIAALEQKLGLGKQEQKSKLYKKYQQEGFGDDFGNFLDDLDNMVERVSDPRNNAKYEQKLLNGSDDDDDDSEQEESDDEELVPMKDPYDDMDEDDSVLEELEREERNGGDQQGDEDEDSEEEAVLEQNGSTDEEDSAEGDDDSVEKEEEPDHDIADTYRPQMGEDIYGKSLDKDANSSAKTSKYVPPHLRHKPGNSDDDEVKLGAIRRGLNNALNRLSEDTLISVAPQVAKLFQSFPTHLVNEMIWKNTKDACVQTPLLMKGLIPVYVACLCGVHIQTGDTVQVGEFLLEAVVTELWNELAAFRKRDPANDEENDSSHAFPMEVASKHICNRMLILCYLYNYSVVHCSFMYDIIRHLLEEFTEVDIECLLLLLSHCGRSLRSDDPLALKEIVLLVQKKSAKEKAGSGDGQVVSSSRAEYMVSAIMDLKNNKRSKQDEATGERTQKLRKLLGRIKSEAAKSSTAKTASESSLRISLQDILNAEQKGRWWKVGASWVGNQYRYNESNDDDDDAKSDVKHKTKTSLNANEDSQDGKLLRLAAKLRMNTDRKRSIFCIIMGSEDCEDAFEKLCRNAMLQNRSERDACRVLLECCGNEKSYNNFYGHLAARMCEFQPQCKFSLQLAYWDMFKQFDTMTARKAANMAKFLYHLVVTHQLLRLMTVIKAMEITEGGDMEESAMIFLTILLSSVLEHFDDATPIKAIFGARQGSSKLDEEDVSKQEQEEGVRASLLLFFMSTLKASPKNEKGSQFRKNFKAAVKALDSDGFEDML